jgi:hypothetical protein
MAGGVAAEPASMPSEALSSAEAAEQRDAGGDDREHDEDGDEERH